METGKLGHATQTVHFSRLTSFAKDGPRIRTRRMPCRDRPARQPVLWLTELPDWPIVSCRCGNPELEGGWWLNAVKPQVFAAWGVASLRR